MHLCRGGIGVGGIEGGETKYPTSVITRRYLHAFYITKVPASTSADLQVPTLTSVSKSISIFAIADLLCGFTRVASTSFSIYKCWSLQYLHAADVKKCRHPWQLQVPASASIDIYKCWLYKCWLSTEVEIESRMLQLLIHGRKAVTGKCAFLCILSGSPK